MKVLVFVTGKILFYGALTIAVRKLRILPMLEGTYKND